MAEVDKRIAQFEYLIRQRLLRGGFRVVSSTEVQDVGSAEMQTGEGCFDRFTGRRDEHCWNAQQTRVRAALKRELSCDALLDSAVVIVAARFKGSLVRWDGVVRTIGGKGGTGAMGWVSASSLWIRLYDLQGRELMWRSGGVEHLLEVQAGLWNDRVDPIPEDMMLRDPARNLLAVLIALGPLAGEDHPETPSCVDTLRRQAPRIGSSNSGWKAFHESCVQQWRARCELRHMLERGAMSDDQRPEVILGDDVSGGGGGESPAGRSSFE